MSNSYSDYSESYTEGSESNSSKSSRSSKKKSAPAFTFANIPAEVSFSLGEYCTVVLKPGKKQYIVEVATNYPRETVNKVQFTFGEHGCSVTQAENLVRSAISQPIPIETHPSNLDQHDRTQQVASVPPTSPPFSHTQVEATISDGPRLNPRDFYRRPKG